MLQYIGFVSAGGAREYSFTLSAKEVPSRLFTVSIANALFRPGLLRFQEGPEICYGKLMIALKTEEGQTHPLDCRQCVTESEVEFYRSAGKSKARVWTEEQRLEARQRFKTMLKQHA